jgi:hypothetical protein
MIHARPRYWQLSPAAMLGLKLYALAAMVADHADWMLFDGALGFHATWGRTVFPVFAVLLANNLARWGEPDHMLHSLSARMAIFGLLATPAYYYLVHGTLFPVDFDVAALVPLNVMFTLSAAVAVCAFVQLRAYVLAAALGLVVGSLVDYGWFGLLAVVLPWSAFRSGFMPSAALLVACLLLYPINGNLWALAAVPLVAVATYVQGDAPRWKWLFYVAYPGHLAVLALVKFAL